MLKMVVIYHLSLSGVDLFFLTKYVVLSYHVLFSIMCMSYFVVVVFTFKQIKYTF